MLDNYYYSIKIYVMMENNIFDKVFDLHYDEGVNLDEISQILDSNGSYDDLDNEFDNLDDLYDDDRDDDDDERDDD